MAASESQQASESGGEGGAAAAAVTAAASADAGARVSWWVACASRLASALREAGCGPSSDVDSGSHRPALGRLSAAQARRLGVAARGVWRLLERACVPRCPACDTRYHLAEGCTHVHCEACGTHHCHACLRRFPSHLSPGSEPAMRAALAASGTTTVEAADTFALSLDREMYLRDPGRFGGARPTFQYGESPLAHAAPCSAGSTFCPIYIEDRLLDNEETSLEDVQPAPGAEEPVPVLQSLRLLHGSGARLSLGRAGGVLHSPAPPPAWLLPAGLPAMRVLGRMALAGAGEEAVQGDGAEEREKAAGMAVILRTTAVLSRALPQLENEAQDSLDTLTGDSSQSLLGWLFPLLLFAGREQLRQDLGAEASTPHLTALRFLGWLQLPVHRRPLHEHLCVSIAYHATVFNPQAIMLPHADGPEHGARMADPGWRARAHDRVQRMMLRAALVRARTISCPAPHDATLFYAYDVFAMLYPPDVEEGEEEHGGSGSEFGSSTEPIAVESEAEEEEEDETEEED